MHNSHVSIELVLQDVMVVLATGLMVWLARVPFCDLKSNPSTSRTLGFNRNGIEPSRDS